MLANKLERGDTIGVVHTSNTIPEERNKEIQSSIEFLKALGIKVKFGKYINDNTLGYGIPAIKKAEEINKMFEDKEVKAIFGACGGYNVNSVLDYLDYEMIKNNPKIVSGYSDLTSLINAIYLKTGLVTFYGPNFTSLSELTKGEATYTRKETIKRFIEGSLKFGEEEDKIETIKEGVAEGILIGGNLSLISRFSSGKYSYDFNNKILFIEEAAFETPPAGVSSYLYTMKQNGVFNKIKGLWIGSYENEIQLEKIVLDVLEDEYNFPIIKSNNFGHINNKTVIPIGVKAKIDTNTYEKIKLIEKCIY